MRQPRNLRLTFGCGRPILGQLEFAGIGGNGTLGTNRKGTWMPVIYAVSHML
jgi:hypothetical protein